MRQISWRLADIYCEQSKQIQRDESKVIEAQKLARQASTYLKRCQGADSRLKEKQAAYYDQHTFKRPQLFADFEQVLNQQE